MGKTGKGNTINLRTIGNALMGLSMVGVLITFYPVIKEELYYRTTYVYKEKPVSNEFNLQINSIKLNGPVIENVDPFQPVEYLPALKKGVAHARTSNLPGNGGTVYLFAHSSDLPWRMTRYNTAFFRLSRVNKGDEVIITFKGKKYRYQVKEKQVVRPDQVEFITRQSKDQLILQTCTPIGTSLKRLLVFADPIDNS